MENILAIYDNACRAVSEAKTILDVKQIIGRADAFRAAARQARNRELEMDALEIRVRAERRLGEIIKLLKESRKIRTRKSRATRLKRTSDIICLEDEGISPGEYRGYERLSNMIHDVFEGRLQEWRAEVCNKPGRRVPTPLLAHKRPFILAHRERIRHAQMIDASDPFDQFRAPDGSKIADMLVGEVRRAIHHFGEYLIMLKQLEERIPFEMVDHSKRLREILSVHEFEEIAKELPLTKKRIRDSVSRRRHKEFDA